MMAEMIKPNGCSWCSLTTEQTSSLISFSVISLWCFIGFMDSNPGSLFRLLSCYTLIRRTLRVYIFNVYIRNLISAAEYWPADRVQKVRKTSLKQLLWQLCWGANLSSFSPGRTTDNILVDGVKSRHGNFRLLQDKRWESNYETAAEQPKSIIALRHKAVVITAIQFQRGQRRTWGPKHLCPRPHLQSQHQHRCWQRLKPSGRHQ